MNSFYYTSYTLKPKYLIPNESTWAKYYVIRLTIIRFQINEKRSGESGHLCLTPQTKPPLLSDTTLKETGRPWRSSQWRRFFDTFTAFSRTDFGFINFFFVFLVGFIFVPFILQTVLFSVILYRYKMRNLLFLAATGMILFFIISKWIKIIFV